MEELKNVDSDKHRIHGDLYQVFYMKDDQGNVVQHINKPLKVEMRIRDILSVIIVGFLLTIAGKCPWLTDFDVALKRTLVGAFPASLSATVTDSLT